MGDEDQVVRWYAPEFRCLFPIGGMHVSRSLKRTLQKQKFVVTFDSDFENVVRGCMREEGTWITEELVQLYLSIFEEGWAHSAECRLEGKLVGGVFGLSLRSCFTAESMFSRVSDASKVALWSLIEKCRELGYTIFDAQVMNPHLASLGGFEIPNTMFVKSLSCLPERMIRWPESKHF